MAGGGALSGGSAGAAAGERQRAGPAVVSLSLPVDGFVDVARCVTGAAAGELDLGFEAIDDLQLAVELVLLSGLVTGASATVGLTTDATALTITIERVDADEAERRLLAASREGMELGELLSRLVDAAEVVRRPAPALALRKALPSRVA